MPHTGLSVDTFWVDEYSKIELEEWGVLTGEFTMPLSSEQYIEMGKAAMQALVSCNDSIILTETEIAEKAWALAQAMSRKYSEQNPAVTLSGGGGGGGSGAFGIGAIADTISFIQTSDTAERKNTR